jgi:hypothetical protein
VVVKGNTVGSLKLVDSIAEGMVALTKVDAKGSVKIVEKVTGGVIELTGAVGRMKVDEGRVGSVVVLNSRYRG